MNVNVIVIVRQAGGNLKNVHVHVPIRTRLPSKPSKFDMTKRMMVG